MKGSGVVQGLKSLVHSQLPLTAKESQRLLTALTSSFRRHLDEVHPSKPGDDDEKPLTDRAAGKPKHAVHSSSSFAEQHLASVLTNPLFSKGGQVLDYASAKLDLTTKPRDDPLKLLEEYQDKGAASVDIAELCLEAFWKSITVLPEDKRRLRIRSCQTGRRALLWLLKSGRLEKLEYVNNIRFTDLLVRSLCLEGEERRIWDWLQLDLAVGHETGLINTNDRSPPYKNMMRPYHWRGRLLRALAAVKLHPWSQLDMAAQNYSIPRVHDAMDVYFHAYDMKSSARHDHHLRWIPLDTVSMLIQRAVGRAEFRPRGDLDPCRMDKFISCVTAIKDGRYSPLSDKTEAEMSLLHPTKPSADRAFHLLRAYYRHPPVTDKWRELLTANIEMHSRSRSSWFLFAVRTSYLLWNAGRNDDAQWVRGRVQEHITDMAPAFDRYLRRHEVDAELANDAEVQYHNKKLHQVPLPAAI